MKAFTQLHLWLVPWRTGDAEGIERIAQLGTITSTPEEAEQTAKELREMLA